MVIAMVMTTMIMRMDHDQDDGDGGGGGGGDDDDDDDDDDDCARDDYNKCKKLEGLNCLSARACNYHKIQTYSHRRYNLEARSQDMYSLPVISNT